MVKNWIPRATQLKKPSDQKVQPPFLTKCFVDTSKVSHLRLEMGYPIPSYGLSSLCLSLLKEHIIARDGKTRFWDHVTCHIVGNIPIISAIMGGFTMFYSQFLGGTPIHIFQTSVPWNSMRPPFFIVNLWNLLGFSNRFQSQLGSASSSDISDPNG